MHLAWLVGQATGGNRSLIISVFFFRVIQMTYCLWERGVQGYEKMSLIFPWSCVNESWIIIAFQILHGVANG